MSAETYDNEAIEEEQTPLLKQKKPRSQKQMEAFEKVKQKRRENIEAKKQEKLLNSAKMILEQHTDIDIGTYGSSKTSLDDEWGTRGGGAPVEKPKLKRQTNKPQPIQEDEDDEESEEEEIIVVKKSRKPKQQPKPKLKKVRQVIIEESETETEDEEEEDEEEYIPRQKQNKKMKPQAQVIRQPQYSYVRNYDDLFC